MSALYRIGNLLGNPAWPFTVRVDGEDLVVDNILVTCFGGAYDPQDNGSTASGVSTLDPDIDAVSLPMADAGDAALAGSPLPRLPWGTAVVVTLDGLSYTPQGGVIDLGPGLAATDEGTMEAAHALDLTAAAALHFAPAGSDPKELARTFERRGSYRVLGGAKYLPAVAA